MHRAGALTFDAVVGAVCCRPSWAALSPADIPPVGSAKLGQHEGAQRGAIPRAPQMVPPSTGRARGKPARLPRLSFSREAVWPRGKKFVTPQI